MWFWQCVSLPNLNRSIIRSAPWAWAGVCQRPLHMEWSLQSWASIYFVKKKTKTWIWRLEESIPQYEPAQILEVVRNIAFSYSISWYNAIVITMYFKYDNEINVIPRITNIKIVDTTRKNFLTSEKVLMILYYNNISIVYHLNLLKPFNWISWQPCGGRHCNIHFTNEKTEVHREK